ncbi:hypothetical protein T439DRAFT_349538 [Meredithblackwellia eburnea MCA 4105]
MVKLKSIYSVTARAFLLSDTETAAANFEQLSQVSLPVQTTDNNNQFPRKLTTLRINWLALLKSNTPPTTLDKESYPVTAALLNLDNPDLIRALWHSAVHNNNNPQSPDLQDINPTAEASHLHPDIPVALVLAALKLDQPALARQVAEAWFGSVSEDVDRIIFDRISYGTTPFDWEDYQLGADGLARKKSPASSSILADLDIGLELLDSWLTLYDLLGLHVLPRLAEWEGAMDFIAGQSVENGGWVPQERVDSSIQHLKSLQLQEEEDALALSIQLEQDKARLERQRRSDAKGKTRASTSNPTSSAESSPNGKSSSSSKSRKSRSKTGPASNGASSDESSSSTGELSSRNPTSASSAAHNTSTQPPATGFAALRSHLSTYLSRGNEQSQLPPTTNTPQTPRSWTSSLIHTLTNPQTGYAGDPVKILTVVCFLFALTSWVRRTLRTRRLQGKEGLGVTDAVRLVMGKVVETVKMGTRVTSL